MDCCVNVPLRYTVFIYFQRDGDAEGWGRGTVNPFPTKLVNSAEIYLPMI